MLFIRYSNIQKQKVKGCLCYLPQDERYFVSRLQQKKGKQLNCFKSLYKLNGLLFTFESGSHVACIILQLVMWLRMVLAS